MKTTEVNTKVYCDICDTLCEWKADYYNEYLYHMPTEDIKMCQRGEI